MPKPTPSTSDTGASETRLFRIVADRIRGLIRDERIAPGERLPSERDLATQLSVSRASVREGLIALELTGVVEVRGGSGIYVSDKHDVAAGQYEASCGPFEVLSARRLVEGEIAAIAARMATDGAIDAILKAVDEMERHHENQEENDAADRKFHLAIASATGNSALVGMVNYLWEQRGGLWQRMEEHFKTDELCRATLADHRSIVTAIASHDPAAARRAMRAHLERVTREFSRGWGTNAASPPGISAESANTKES